MASDVHVLREVFRGLELMLVVLVGAILLWLKPPHPARTILGIAWVIVAPLLFVDFTLPNEALNTAMHLGLDEILILGGLPIILFLRWFPTPAPWRSPQGITYAAMAAYILLTACLWPAILLTHNNTPLVDAFFSPYSAAGVLAIGVSITLAVSRATTLPGPERASAMRIISSMAGFTVFITYWLTGAALTSMHVISYTRYGLSIDIQNDPAVLPRLGVEFGVLLVLVLRHRQPIAMLYAAIGVLAVLLDQVSRQDIIDLGITNIIAPLVVVAAVARRGELGVRKVPARAALPLAGIVGLTAWILVIALAQILAPGDAFILAVSIVMGLFVGLVVTYAVRPRALGVSLYRVTPSGPHVITSTIPGALPAHAERYEVQRKLHEGGQGVLYLARDTALHRQVVLKRVPPTQAREARAVAAIEHPNVVRIHDIIEREGGTELVLEYVEGGDLRGLLARRGALPPAEADRLLEGVLSALDAAHARGIAHGDVKPENILLTPEGDPKLADFGSARSIGPTTTAAESSGTLLYMAPEQVRGEPASTLTDVYAAGLVYAELLAGKPLRDARGLDDFVLRAKILAGDHVPDLGERTRVVRQALDPNPQARFASAAQMQEAIRRIATAAVP